MSEIPTDPNDPIAPTYAERKDSVGNLRTGLTGAGLTKREYFAALAMQGILASGEEASEMGVAQISMEMADALIVVLNGGSVE